MMTFEIVAEKSSTNTRTTGSPPNDRVAANAKLAQQLEAAYQKVQEIAEKTVEGSSQAKSLADLQRLLIEQGRKRNQDKS